MTDQAKLEQLNRQFEAMFARMQSTEHAAAVDQLMNAYEQEICAFLEAYYQAPRAERSDKVIATRRQWKK